jgi:hypothetical protein
VDTEASIQELSGGKQSQTFRLGYAIHCMLKDGKWFSTGYELWTIADFWDLLDRVSYIKKRLYVFAHNMAYDYTILKLDSYISSRKLEITMRVIDSIFMIKADNILFLSSTNFYQQSLAKLGEIFTMKKMEKPDFMKCQDSELMPYCQRDTEVLAHIIKEHIRFFKENDLGCFKPTIAGQAFTAFKHRFMHKQLLVHNYTDILNMEKESYRGGRCEVFKMGKHSDIYCLDINSMYPFVMKNRLYPAILRYSKPVTDCSVNSMIEGINEGSFLLAKCDIRLTKPVIACKREKLMFPIGNITQTITSPEIDYIVKHPECGEIIKTHSVVSYSKENIFSDYVDYFYGLRKSTNNSAYETMCKLMLNSLYGKFGQKESTDLEELTDVQEIKKYTDIMDWEHTNEIFTGLGMKYVRLGNNIYRISKIDGEFSRDSIPIIASSVTSYARILLYELMEKAGLDNLLYCDTDSLFVNESGFENLHHEISPTELGKLKLVQSGNVDIRGAKDYTFNNEIKLKGVKKDAVKLPDGTYKQFQFQTKHIRYRKGTPDGVVMLEPIIKKFTRNYDKGIVREGIVFPHEFSDF